MLEAVQAHVETFHVALTAISVQQGNRLQGNIQELHETTDKGFREMRREWDDSRVVERGTTQVIK